MSKEESLRREIRAVKSRVKALESHMENIKIAVDELEKRSRLEQPQTSRERTSQPPFKPQSYEVLVEVDDGHEDLVLDEGGTEVNWRRGESFTRSVDLGEPVQDATSDGTTLLLKSEKVFYIYSVRPNFEKIAEWPIGEKVVQFESFATNTKHIATWGGNYARIFRKRTKKKGYRKMKSLALVGSKEMVGVEPESSGRLGGWGVLGSGAIAGQTLWLAEESSKTVYLVSLEDYKLAGSMALACDQMVAHEETMFCHKGLPEPRVQVYSSRGEHLVTVDAPRGLRTFSSAASTSSVFLLLARLVGQTCESAALSKSYLVTQTYSGLNHILGVSSVNGPPSLTKVRTPQFGPILLHIVRDKFLFFCRVGSSAYNIFELPSCNLLYSKKFKGLPVHVDDLGVLIRSSRGFVVHSFAQYLDPRSTSPNPGSQPPSLL